MTMFTSNSPDQINSMTSVQPGKVQSIVQQMSTKMVSNTNCKCGLENCQCKLVVSKNSTSMSIQRSEDTIQNIIDLQPESATSIKIPTIEENKLEVEIRELRDENLRLQNELEHLKNEYEVESMKLIAEIETQRTKNQAREDEIKQINSRRESEVLQTTENFRMSITKTEQDCQNLKIELSAKEQKINELEDKLRTLCCQLKEMENAKKDCESLQSDLRRSREFGLEHLNNLQESKELCQKFSSESESLKLKIKNLEIELDEASKKSNQLAEELSEAKKISIQVHDNRASREVLINAIKDIKRRYDELKKHQIEMVNCYEMKIEEMQARGSEQSCSIEGVGDDPLIIKLQKFGLQSLSSDELVELHARVRAAMMNLPKLSSSEFDVRNAIDAREYCSRIVDELKAKYNFNDEISLHDCNLRSVAEKDFESTSTRTAPALNHPCCKNLKKKRRSKSTEIGSKSTVKCVTITSRKGFK